jgi:hypothetical protein
MRISEILLVILFLQQQFAGPPFIVIGLLCLVLCFFTNNITISRFIVLTLAITIYYLIYLNNLSSVYFIIDSLSIFFLITLKPIRPPRNFLVNFLLIPILLFSFLQYFTILPTSELRYKHFGLAPTSGFATSMLASFAVLPLLSNSNKISKISISIIIIITQNIASYIALAILSIRKSLQKSVISLSLLTLIFYIYYNFERIISEPFQNSIAGRIYGVIISLGTLFENIPKFIMGLGNGYGTLTKSRITNIDTQVNFDYLLPFSLTIELGLLGCLSYIYLIHRFKHYPILLISLLIISTSSNVRGLSILLLSLSFHDYNRIHNLQ